MSKILIVDDVDVNISVLAACLKKYRHEVVSCRNGREAMELARKEAPDLIITDILMPVMDGYELFRHLKEDSGLRHIPVIFYTATYTDPKDEAYAMALGADRFLVKPAKPEQIEKAVSEVLEARRLAGPAPAAAPDEEQALRGHNDALFRKLQRKIAQLEAEAALRAEAERKLALAAKALEKKNREMQDFLYLASHELRTPLIKLQGYSENVRNYCAELRALGNGGAANPEKMGQMLNREIPEAVGYILSGVGDLDRMFGELIRLSRLWSVPPKPGPVHMNALMDEMLRAMAWQIKDSGAEISCAALPDCFADREQVGQILFELLDNAVKYRDKARKPEIKISGNKVQSGTVSYTVADNGRGLSPLEKNGKVWELFYRGDPGGPVPGEGIGLSILKRVAERNGGKIKADDAPGGGAVFTLELPYAK